MKDVDKIRRLRFEVSMMASRIKAILDCDEAMDALADDDVFGETIRGNLALDLTELNAVLEETK